jgi:hypothetical protein
MHGKEEAEEVHRMRGVAQSREYSEDADNDKCKAKRSAQLNAPDQV